MVAIELAASCSPFRKSNINATAISRTRSRLWAMKSTSRGLEVLDQQRADLVGHVLEPVHHLLQVVVDLGPHDISHRVLARGTAIEGAEAVVVEGVGFVLQARHL